MIFPNPQTLYDKVFREEAFAATAPKAYFQAWQRGAALAGPQWFGDGTSLGLAQGRAVPALAPNLSKIHEDFARMTERTRIFLALLVSFHDLDAGRALLDRCALNGLHAFLLLDLDERQVIATLLLTYTNA